jgi:O-antigen/teichoic acid export membrane protein
MSAFDVSRRRVFRDLGSTTGSVVLVRALGFLNLVVLARVLSPPEFGQYVVFVAFAVVLVPFADGGFFPLVTRAAADRRWAPFTFSARADRLRLPLWGAAIAASAGAAAFGHAGVLPMFALLGAIGQAQTDCMAGELQGLGRYTRAAVLRVCNSLVALAGVAVVAADPTPETAMAVFAGSRLIPVAIVRCATRLRRSAERPAQLPLSRRAAIPFALYAAITVLYVRSDVLLLGLLGVDPAQVGAYGAVYNVVIAVQLIPSALLATVYPRLVTAPADRVPQLVGMALAAGFSITTVCVALALVDPALVMQVFGRFYAETATGVAPLLGIAIPIAVSQVLTSALQARGREGSTWRLAIPALVANVGLNLILIPGFGVRGALIATSCSEALLAMWLAVYAWKVEMIDVRLLAGLSSLSVLVAVTVTGPAAAVALLAIVALAWAADAFKARVAVLRALGR